MKIAKASKNDIETTNRFLSVIDNLFDSRDWRQVNDWREWDDSDPDKKRLLQIEKDITADWCYNEDTLNNLILFQFIKEKFRECEFNWRRVVWASDALIATVCDPNKDYLDWHPYLARAMEHSILGE